MKIAALFSLFALATALPVAIQQRGIMRAAVELIGHLEGFRGNFYWIQGHKTVGYGHDCVAKKDCHTINVPLSEPQAADLLSKDLSEFESCVCAMENAKELNANQYGALVSFAYNTGCAGFQSAWQGAMSQKDFNGICHSLPTTNTLGGLLNTRRQKEGHFCMQPTEKPSGC
ncbi:lysozyme [Aspergillus melleus]|uniref:lysozyme n=1 Tax=Aspergillus melleus TaxID=138277 RepID=UPI001E8D4205|nr:uncharacterized protein LDX57_009738 [Aspergillus melleus]KAH8432092.1 hypothetical protein LDX57_009738 [Aspergillus melleus]